MSSRNIPLWHSITIIKLKTTDVFPVGCTNRRCLNLPQCRIKESEWIKNSKERKRGRMWFYLVRLSLELPNCYIHFFFNSAFISSWVLLEISNYFFNSIFKFWIVFVISISHVFVSRAHTPLNSFFHSSLSYVCLL